MKGLKTLLIIFPAILIAQSQIIKNDFDGDRISDEVYFESAMGKVIYELSSQNFKKVKTDDFVDRGNITLHTKKNGFEVTISEM